VPNGGSDRPPVHIHEVRGEARAGLVERRCLNEPFDAIMRARLSFDQSGRVAVNESAAVEVEAKAVLAAPRMVGCKLPVDVMRQPIAFDLAPVHGQVLGVAEAALLKVERAQNARHGARLRAQRRSESDDGE
jgi:hypothetical protein